MRFLSVTAMSAAFVVLQAFDAKSDEALVKRASQIECAIVQVGNDKEMGTGFFINSTGRLVTAAHVMFSRNPVNGSSETTYSRLANPYMSSARYGKVSLQILDQPTSQDLFNLKRGLLEVETKTKTPCYLKTGDSTKLEKGEDLIGFGFPAQATTPVLYTGILSARYIVSESNGSNDFLRVKMPTSPGASGGPIINERNEVVGVNDAIPFLVAPDVEPLASLDGSGRPSSGAIVSGADVNKVLGELASEVIEYGSPGSGYAIPIEFLSQPSVARVR